MGNGFSGSSRKKRLSETAKLQASCWLKTFEGSYGTPKTIRDAVSYLNTELNCSLRTDDIEKVYELADTVTKEICLHIFLDFHLNSFLLKIYKAEFRSKSKISEDMWNRFVRNIQDEKPKHSKDRPCNLASFIGFLYSDQNLLTDASVTANINLVSL